MTDAIIGMLYVMTKGRCGEAYNICTESGETTVLDLAQMMAGMVKDRNIEVKFDETRRRDIEVVHAVSRVCADSGQLRSLGWKPKVSLEEACQRMMTYYGVLV